MDKTFCFDIDGTICSETYGNYNTAIPFPDMIRMINCLYKQGHTITIHTARGGTTGINWEAVTETQLKKWGVKYHHLVMGKPAADVYIDDKSIKPEEFFRRYECNLCDPPGEGCTL
jgi:hypothetical protein